MANILLGDKEERSFTYDGILQLLSGANTYQYKFVQEILVSIDDTDLDRDRVDNGVPAFTRVGDVKGNFSFALKNAVDLYEAVDPPTNEWLASWWMDRIALGLPAEVSFIQTFKGTDPGITGSAFARLRWTGRIMKVTPQRLRDVGVDEISVEGEIIAWVSALREVA